MDMWQIRIKDYTNTGAEMTSDMFVCNDPSLCMAYLEWMVIKDVVIMWGKLDS